MGFNAAWFAKAASWILVALTVGFVGAVYLGAKLFPPGPAPGKLETGAGQSASAPTGSASGEHAGDESPDTAQSGHQTDRLPGRVENSGPAQRSANEKGQATDPPRYQASRSEFVASDQEELRIGQQERRRLRAQRRTDLENANASLHRRPRKTPPEDTRAQPFFPFRF
jgi:hypothetical protein